jgi:hypothetical protein
MNQIILKMNIRHKNITAVPFLQPITECTHTSKGPKKEVKILQIQIYRVSQIRISSLISPLFADILNE